MSKTFATKLLTQFALMAGLVPAANAFGAAPALPDKIDFNRDVRPILSDNCFACHGPDKNTRKANLRLDTKEGAFAALKGGGGHAIVSGKPDESEVYRRISTKDEDDLMPPAEFNKTLSERQIAIVKKWIEQGAEFKGHWAYLPVQAPPLPSVETSDGRRRTAIDKLVEARVREAELTPAPQADRVTLIRRLYFDLIGLPPTKEQVDAFVADKSDNAYEKVVDSLLNSPHYGERMAVSWLDLVRYADTIGYHSDNPMPVSPYRDYVIKSFNENKPFDRFTIEQLAGDLLPDATTETKVASAYNRLLQTTEEGGAQPKEYEVKYAADRVRNVSTVWLAQTMGCAECHDHKFDPTTTHDFYTMAAFFADVQEAGVGKREPGMPVPDEKTARELKSLDEAIASTRAKLDGPATPDLVADQAEWERQMSGSDVRWTTLDPDTFEVQGESKLREEAGGVLRSFYKVHPKENVIVRFKPGMKTITGIRLETLSDAELPAGGPGTAPNGNFVLTEARLFAGPADQKKPDPLTIGVASADHSQETFPIAHAVDNNNDTGWAILPETNKPHQAVFELKQPASFDAEKVLTVVLEFQSKYAQHSIGKLRISATSDPNPSRLSLPPAVREALAVASEQRTKEQKGELTAYYRTIAPKLSPVRDELNALTAKKADLLASAPTVLVSISAKPRTVRVLPRGNWLDESQPPVEPAVPAFLGKVDVKQGTRATRLDLARWLVRKDNPLTARVFMNRVWKMLMGRGLTQPLDDLGLQGELPSNPELLDYLASDFMEHGWDVKRAIRNIVLSETYRQSSLPTPQQREADPFNRLFARQGRFRLDAEFVRDNALAISGLLVDKVGGPSAKPYQPAGYWFALNFPTREWENDKGEGLYRRGLYTWWQRSFLHPSLLAFDAPTREECTAERPRSNIPQQALALLNDPTYVEAARVFAERIVRSGGNDAASRIQWAFGQALSREATAEELTILSELLQKHSETYARDEKAAKALVSNGAAPVPTDLNVGELAAWTSVARAILNLHETITRY